MKAKYLSAIFAALALSSTSVPAALTILFSNGSNTANNFVHTVSDLGADPVTFGTSGGIGAIDATNDSFAVATAGTIQLTYSAFTTGFNPNTFTGTAPSNSAPFRSNGTGLGINGGGGNQFNATEAFTFTVSLSGFGSGVELQLTEYEAASTPFQLWQETSPGVGTLLASGSNPTGLGLTVEDGGVFAVYLESGGASRFTSLTFETIPEPSGLAFLGLGLAALGARRRRR
ncbi:MAG: PEP-CTERM sorting domain-containing protein [Verrucomicrobiota bacterium]